VHEPGTVDDGSGGGSVDWSVSEPTPEADGGTASAPVTGGTGRGRGTAGSVLDAPETDEERPLTEHIEELVRRLAAVILVVVGATAVGVPFAEPVIDFLWYSFLPAGEAPRVYGPLELVLTKLKVAGLAGVVVGLPALVYEAYLFMRPGLYAHERRYYLASVPTSLLLALVGIAFAHLIVLPTVFAYFTGYTQDAATVAFGLGETFNLIVILMAYFAFVFQIPLFVMLAIMMGVTDRAWLEDRRLYFWGGFLGLAFVFTPDPTGMAPVVVAATMIGLFEGTLLLLRWTDRGAFAPDSIAAHRPYAWGLAAVVGYAAGPWPVPSGYHGALPTALTRTLADLGIGGAAPALIAGGAIAVFEGLAAAGRRTESLRLRLAFLRARPAAWITAVVVGYLATPSPLPLRVADSVTLPVPLAVAVVAGLIAAFETGLIALRRRRG
jgi:sec-independent protein translocase protein TatC